jgi:hypothetical protein
MIIERADLDPTLARTRIAIKIAMKPQRAARAAGESAGVAISAYLLTSELLRPWRLSTTGVPGAGGQLGPAIGNDQRLAALAMKALSANWREYGVLADGTKMCPVWRLMACGTAWRGS